MSLGEEYSMYATGDYASVDSTRFNNKLNIEDTYSEVNSHPNGHHYVINDSVYAIPVKNSKWIKSHENGDHAEYSVVDLHKKYEERLRKVGSSRGAKDDDLKVNELLKNLDIYEDIEIPTNKNCSNKTKVNDESNIYELVRAP